MDFRRHFNKKKMGQWLILSVILCFVWILSNIYIHNVKGVMHDNNFKSRILFALENILQSEGFHNISQSDEWNLIIVNRWNEIPDNYSVTLTELSNGQKVDSRIYPALQAMFDAARKDEVYPIVREGYRTEEEQRATFEEKVQAYIYEGYSKERAEKLAKEWVALPGTSEHQLGLAVDINADKTRSANEEVYAWLAENAYKYGFILRYPQGKEDITGTGYEPWHYRYVGTKAAPEIYQSKICLEEYIERN